MRSTFCCTLSSVQTYLLHFQQHSLLPSAALSAKGRERFLLAFWQYVLLHIEKHNGHKHMYAAIESKVALFATLNSTALLAA